MEKTLAEREAELVVQRSATIEANNKQEVSWVHSIKFSSLLIAT
jgi:hypothetical protein